jgi:ligand-binding sensor domain-containing protein/anti-sigma regulatory factor (Ser/Thr protein kinase)
MSFQYSLFCFKRTSSLIMSQNFRFPVRIIACLIAAIILFAVDVSAQSAEPFFKNIKTENGLSHNKVNCILKDKRGFVWFGTEDGLTRFDGRYYVVFKSRPNDTQVLSGNIINDLYEDKDGILWIATADGGITKYDYRLSITRQFKQFRHNAHDTESIPEDAVKKIVEDRTGNLWLATSNSYVVRLNKKTEKFDTPVKKGTSGILTLLMDNHDTLRVGRAGGGLLSINTRTLGYREDPRYRNLYAKLPHASIAAIFRDNEYDLWYGTWDNMIYHQRAGSSDLKAMMPSAGMKGMLPDDFVSFAEDEHQQIWMAGKNSGVMVYNKDSGLFTNYRHNALKSGSLSDNQVNVIYRDRQGIIWIGTNNGVSILNSLFTPFVIHDLPEAGKPLKIYDFQKDKKGRLWIGTSEGIYLKSPHLPGFEHRKIIFEGQDLAVTKFFADQDGAFYLGTDYTLFLYDQQTNKISLLPNTLADPVMKKLISSRIVSIIRDTINDHPVLLVSPYGHYFAYYDLTDKKWISRKTASRNIVKELNIKDNLIRKVYKDSRGITLLATTRRGLGDWQHDAGRISYNTYDLQDKTTISNNDVFDIQEDHKGNYWVGTYGGGLNYFNRRSGKFAHIAESSNLTEGLQTDASGNVWMICNGHFHKYDPLKKNYSCYDLPDLRVSDGVKGYLYKDDQNNLYAAGDNYYVAFDPKAVAPIDNEPRIFFTDFKIFNISYNQLLSDPVIELDHEQNYFSFEFSAPEFTGENIHYDYMLEGVDRHWISADKQNFASYSNLKSGKYTFKVRAGNWKGSPVGKYSSVVISIRPPFWLTWWFSLIVVGLMALIMYAVYRYRIREIFEQQKVRNQIAQDLHDNIGSTLSSISVYSEVAKIYQEQDKSGPLIKVLQTIGTTAIEMISEMGDTVWAVNSKNDNLRSIVQRINSYARPLCSASDILFKLNADERLMDIGLEMTVRKNLYLILKEAINNAVKHSACKTIEVDIKVKKNVFDIAVKDDGIGFIAAEVMSDQSDSLSGNGLNNIRSRAEELMGKLVTDSTPGAGSTVRLIFKI